MRETPPDSSAEAGIVVGIDIGGTGTRFVAADPATLNVSGRTTVSTPTSGTPNEILRFLRTHIDRVAQGRRPLGVGVGASGPVDIDGVIRNPDTLPGFTGLPILSMINSIIDGPVEIENDAVCAAIAEYRVGAAKGSGRSLHVTLGTGVGVCLLDHGAPFRLHTGTHPEGGHISVATTTTTRLCYCGRTSCWEQAASRRNLQRVAADILGRAPTDPTVLSELAARAEQGDSVATTAYDQYGLAVADGLGTLIVLYGPETVVIGGSASQHLEIYRDVITRSLDALAGWIPQHRITKTELDDYGGALGGAQLSATALAQSDHDADQP